MKIGLILFLMFTIIPAIETWLIIVVGTRLGATETVLTLVAAGLLGAWLGKRAGGSVLRELFEGLRRGEPPADKLVEGVLALIGAVLLVTPGYISDVVGLLLLWQPVRRWLAPRIKDSAWEALKRRGFTVGGGAPGPAMRRQQESEAKFDHPVPD